MNLTTRANDADRLAVYQPPVDRVTYNFRYFLPHAPQWGTQSLCAQRLDELVRFCQQANIDAVQFYVNTLPGTYYMPAHSASEQSQWAGWMKDCVAPAVRSIGVSYQLNFQMLLGACTHGMDMREQYAWETMVDSRGRDALGVACPIGPRFRRAMGQMLGLWAATRPDVIWIDDDFRLHNHGLADGGPDYYCYCDLHLDAFSRKTGRSWTREELVAQVLAPGEPSPERDQWLELLGESMVDTAAWIRQTVHHVSPHTRLALMTSAPEVHSVEGRDWHKLITALSGAHRPMTRPCSGCYTGTLAPIKSQTCTYALMAKSMVIVERAFGRGGVDFGPELENTRFTTWSKSVVNTHYVLMLGQLLGTSHITMSLNDLEGSPIDEEPTTAPMLVSIRPRLESLAALRLGDWDPVGVTMLVDPRGARKIELESDDGFGELAGERPWEDLILQAGIPARFVQPEDPVETGDIVVLDAPAASWLSNEQAIRMLAGGLLLDAGAACVLQRRGFGEHLGVTVGAPATFGALAEMYAADVLPGVTPVRVPLRSNRWRFLEPADDGEGGARVVSWFIDPKNNRHAGSVVFENALGGRVGVFAAIGEMQWGTFFSHARLRWLRGMIRWLGRELFPVLPVCRQHGMTLVRRNADQWLVAHANLATDTLREWSLELASSNAWDAKQLDDAGRWKPIDSKCQSNEDRRCVIAFACERHAFEWFVVLLEPRRHG